MRNFKYLVIVLSLLPVNSVLAQCNQIYYNDFEDSVGIAWSDTTTYAFVNTKLLGPFENQSVDLNLTNLPVNDSVSISFDLYIHDTWEGLQLNVFQIPIPGSSDRWKLELVQSNTIQGSFETSFNNYTYYNSVQSYPDAYPASNPAKTGAIITGLPRRCPTIASYWSSTKYSITKTFYSNSAIGKISFKSLQNQGVCDESWGIDNVAIGYSTTGADTITACDSYTWIDGNSYTTSTNTPTYLLTGQNGCDSVATLDLTIHYSTTRVDTITACDSYTWIDGNTYTTSNNTAAYTLTNQNGCDSVVTLDLTIHYSTNQIYYNDFEDSVGIAWSDTTTYAFVNTKLLGPFGNQTVDLNLTNLPVNDSVSISFDLYIHETWDGNQLNGNSDRWKLELVQSNTIQGSFETSFSTHASGNQSYPDVFFTSNPANSGAMLTGLPSRCYNHPNGSTKYSITKTFYSNSTTGKISFKSLQNQGVCDESWGIDNVMIRNNRTTDVITACDSYTWIDGNTYTSSNNIAAYTLTNQYGCDSLVTLDLTIGYSTTGADTITACDSYTWIDGNSYTTSTNTPTYLLTGQYGCDSLVTLDLTIHYSTTGVDTITACDSYTWIDGNSYSASTNTATYLLTDQYGCDSMVTLDLTIHYSTTGADTITACDSYTWIDGNSYSASTNTATYLLTAQNGCDSIVTLDLTIYSTTGVDTITACDSYTWIDGNSYSASTNTPTYLLTGQNGCDSMVTLDLTIHYSTTVFITDTAQIIFYWDYTEEYYLATGNYFYNGISSVGCDSLAQIELTILPSNVFYVANSFTPNNDGVNDLFFPVFNNVESIIFIIYDRWGNVLFRTDDSQSDGWDGFNNALPLPLSTYTWSVFIKYINGEILIEKGLVNLNR